MGSWTPSIAAKPHGMEMPGLPARLVAMVKMSARYIFNGSSVRSPALKAGSGLVGQMMASTFSNASVKSLADEGADFLGAKVIGVVVAAAQDVGAEDDAAFDLGAEAFLAGASVMVQEVGGVFRAMAVADAVETGEIGGGFGGREDVIDGDGVFGVREGDFDDFRAEGFVVLDRLADARHSPGGRCRR